MSEIALSNNGSFWAPLLRSVGPTLLAGIAAVVIGYGTVRFTEGATQHRLDTLESAKEQQLKTNEKFMTREELKVFMESTLRELGEIHQDVRELRTEIRGGK